MSDSRLLVTQIANEPKCYMGTYPKQCCHFGVLIACYGDDDEDEDEDEDEDDDDDE